jgi:hypothetical protein
MTTYGRFPTEPAIEVNIAMNFSSLNIFFTSKSYTNSPESAMFSLLHTYSDKLVLSVPVS